MRTIAPEAGFLGLPIETDLDALDADVAIVGTPYGWPYPRPGTTAGCSDAPRAVRRRSQRLARFRGHWDFDLNGPMLPDSGRRLVDAGDVPGEPLDGPGNAARTEAALRSVLSRGAVPICLGGDDSVPIPILRAFSDHRPLTVVQVDAHLDYRDEVDGVRDGYSSPMRRASEMAHVARIVHVGLRGVGSARAGDVDDSRDAGNQLVPRRQLLERGVAWLVDQLGADASVFLAFDCDGLDPSHFPAVTARAPGGLTFEEAADLIAGLGRRIRGAAFTEYVPALDVDGRCAHTLARLAILAAAAAGGRG